jgi:serine/threonine protein kinase
VQRVVAVKVLSPGILASAEAEEARIRFDREISLVGRFDHPNVIRFFEAGEEDGQGYLVMEYVDGRTLQEQARSGLPIAEALRYFLQAAQGLQHMHEEGVCHRDIKPDNLLLDSNGAVKIVDLGLARDLLETDALDSPAQSTSVFEENVPFVARLRGNIHYAAPEQLSDLHSADHRSDIYSLACTLFYLSTGEPPFTGGTIDDVRDAHLSGTLPSLHQRKPETSIELDAIFRKMLAKSPDDRYQSMDEVIRAVQLEVIKISQRPGLSGEIVKTTRRLALVSEVQQCLHPVSYWLDDEFLHWELANAPSEAVALEQTIEEASMVGQEFAHLTERTAVRLKIWPRLSRLWSDACEAVDSGCKSIAETANVSEVRQLAVALRRTISLVAETLDEMLRTEIAKLQGMADELDDTPGSEQN